MNPKSNSAQTELLFLFNSLNLKMVTTQLSLPSIKSHLFRVTKSGSFILSNHQTPEESLHLLFRVDLYD